MPNNMLIVHGGGPTAVLNCSLFGAIDEAKKSGKVGRIYGALGGMRGVLTEQFLELDTISDSDLALLKMTPGSAIGTSRDAMEAEDYANVAQILKKRDIRFALFNGGNGTMDTCGKVYRACKDAGLDILVAGIPKTMDNDIAVTDHTPGFASAARYLAGTVQEICADIRSLPIHVCIIEAMGRNAGWITASAALASENPAFCPELIYLPERDFSEDAFLADVEKHWAKGKGVVAVVSEGIHGADNRSLVPPIFQTGRSVYFGDVSAHLAQLVVKELGIKARSEKPGLAGRTSIFWRSDIDCQEAELAGRAAVRAVLEGQTGVMPALRRLSNDPYESEMFLVPIEQVMLTERILPGQYINAAGNGITDAYIQWLRPLMGQPLPQFASFQKS